jgi:3-dehydroquinate synthase
MTKPPTSVFFSKQVSDVVKNLSLGRFSKIFLLADTNTLENCWPLLAGHLPEFREEVEILEVPPGEGSKCIEVATQLWATLIELGADRQSVLINLGGGMITDLGGFIASTYKRGIALYNIPTSVLGQVDAAIGGKTGIDLGALKNQIGTFASPESTIISTEFLSTLPDRELRSGLSEMIKHGLIGSSLLFEQTEELGELTPETVSSLIEEAARVKMVIAENDPLEKGERKKLNFGHTFGHAIESISLESQEPLTHGEAVAVGMMLESLLSKEKLYLSDAESKRIEKALVKFFPGPLKKKFERQVVWSIMQHDKKNVSGKVNCTLLKSIGTASIDNEISEKEFKNVWSQFENFQKWISE